jgi:CO/xanthine dehydrogenase Mo-binding subunit
VLDLKESDVEVTQPAVGGGFGSKIESHQPCYAAVASWVTDRPVRVKYTRDEEFKSTAKRNTMEFEYSLAADADGTLRGFDVDLTVDGGAYASFTVPVVVRSMVHSTGPYNVSAVAVDGRAVYTNKPWAGAMRSFDMFQTTFAIESIIDQLAAEVDIDPVEIRRQNAFDGSQPMATTGQRIDAVGLSETIDTVKTRLDKLAAEQPNNPAKYRGVGVACMWYGCGKTGHHHLSSAFCEIHADGTATVQCGAAEIGQGSQTALTQIAAETLGIPSDDVNFVSDRSTTPDGGVTSASRQTYVSGNAVHLAAEDALGTALHGAAEKLADQVETEIHVDDLAASGGEIEHLPSGETLSFEAVTDHCAHNGQLMTGASAFTPLFEFDLETFEGKPYPTYSFATHGAVVEVDVELGEVSVEHIVASHDVGQAVNPALVEGQIEGGAVMGMGHTLLEEVTLNEQGEINNDSLLDYYIPTSVHTPGIETDLVESAPEEDGPYGAKGVGESALIPIGAAIGNAIADATGARITSLPITPERVLAELPDEMTYL